MFFLTHNISLPTKQFCIKFQLTCHNKSYVEKYNSFSSRSEAKYYLHLQKYSAFHSDRVVLCFDLAFKKQYGTYWTTHTDHTAWSDHRRGPDHAELLQLYRYNTNLPLQP